LIPPGVRLEHGRGGHVQRDTVVGTNDNWIVTDDTDASGDPTVLHVMANDWGAIRPSIVAYSTGLPGLQYAVTVPAGETRIVMHFGAQNPDRAAALTQGLRLTGLGLNALAGISSVDQSRIANFGLPDALEVTPAEGSASSAIKAARSIRQTRCTR